MIVTRDEAIAAARSVLGKVEKVMPFVKGRDEKDVLRALRAAFDDRPELVDHIMPYLPARGSAESEAE